MAAGNVSRTAEVVALYRALETLERRRTPLFADPFAHRFLSPALRAALLLARVPGLRELLEAYSEHRAPGARTSAIGRTRFIDDRIRRARREGLEQLVILGAGYDCRAQRMPELAGATVFEVDRPATQARKRHLLGGAPLPGGGYVAVDFGTDDVGAALRRAGWRQDRPTVFLWEGVTNYLTETAVNEVLALVGQSAAGSLLIFTYIHRGVLDGSVEFHGARILMENVRRLGEPWRFGFLPGTLPEHLARFGLEVEEDLGADAYRARYLPPTSGDLRGYAFYRLAVARRSGGPSAIVAG